MPSIRKIPEHCTFEGCEKPLHSNLITDRYTKIKRPVYVDYCYDHWVLNRKLKMAKTQSTKVRKCKICGESNPTKMAKSNLNINYCSKCDTERRKKFVKKFVHNEDYIKKQKLQWKVKIDNMTEDEKEVYFKPQSEGGKIGFERMRAKDPERFEQHWKKYNAILNAMTPEQKKLHYDKNIAKRKPMTEEEKTKWKSKLSYSLKNKTPEEKLEAQRKRKETINNMTSEELDDWYYNIGLGVRNFQSLNPERAIISGRRFKDYWNNGDVYGKKLKASLRQKVYWSNLSDEKKKQRILATIKATRFNSISKAEIKCFEFLQKQYPDIEHHVFLENSNVDYYIPSLNLYISYLGQYWHALGIRTLKDYFHRKKSRRGINTIKTAKRDRKQFKKHKNIIAIRDMEFNKNNEIAIEAIEVYLKNQDTMTWRERLSLRDKSRLKM